jgi:hypothetical protein
MCVGYQRGGELSAAGACDGVERRAGSRQQREQGVVSNVRRVLVVTGVGATADLVVSRQLVMSLVANRHQAASPKTVA